MMNSNFSGLMMAFFCFLSFLGSTAVQGQTTNGPLYYYLTNYEGRLVADTDPGTALASETTLGEITDTYDCRYEENYFLYARGSDGEFVRAPAGLSALLLNANPDEDLVVLSEGGAAGTYTLSVQWYAGNNRLEIRDAGGQLLLTLNRAIALPAGPDLRIDAPETVTIPVCATRANFFMTFTVEESCDNQPISWNNVSLTFGAFSGGLNFTGNNYREYILTTPQTPGNYPIFFTYMNALGQSVTVSKIITVTAAAGNYPPTIAFWAWNLTDYNWDTVLSDTIYINEDCPPVGFWPVISFVIEDDCEPINIAQITFNGGGSGLPNLNGAGFFFTDPIGPGKMYLEVQGNVSTPGTYFPLVIYRGVQATLRLVVLERPGRLAITATQPADLRFVADINGVCDTTLSLPFSVSFDGSCGVLDPARMETFLDGQPISHTAFNANWNRFSYSYDGFSINMTGEHSLHFRYERPDGEIWELTRPLYLEVTPRQLNSPILILPPDTVSLALNTCTGQPASYWFEAHLADVCTDLEAVQTTFGQNTIPVRPGLSLLRIPAPGQYPLTAEAINPAGLISRDTVVVAVADNSPEAPVCQPTISLPIGASGTAELSPEMLLGADAGCLSPNDYMVRVLDGQPDNLGQVDGCGSYTYEVYAPNQTPTQGFVGAFLAGNWALRTPTQGSVTFGPQELNIALVAQRDYAALAYTFGAAGEWAADYQYLPVPDGATLQFRLLDEAGQLLADWESANQGAIARQVEAGHTLLLYLSIDAAGAAPLSLTLSNWQFTPAAPGAPICTGTVIIEDTTPPTTAIAPEAEVVLSASGQAEIGATELDAGSADNCGPITQQLRRQYTRDPLTCATVAPYYGPWGETVDFNCCDACEAVAVEVRTTDGAGLESVAAASVFVRDDRQPVITAFEIEPACCPNPEACQGAFQYSFRAESGCNVRRPTVTVALDLNADGSPDADLTAATVPQPNNRYKITGWTAPEGQHALLLRAVDGCGNTATATVPFQVLDCSGEAPPIIMLSDGSYGLPQGIDQPLLLPGEPNPFTDQTVLRYWLPAAGEAQLQVLDAAGRQVLMRGGAHDAGWQEWLLTAADLPAAGIYTVVLYYRGQALRQRVARL